MERIYKIRENLALLMVNASAQAAHLEGCQGKFGKNQGKSVYF